MVTPTSSTTSTAPCLPRETKKTPVETMTSDELLRCVLDDTLEQRCNIRSSNNLEHSAMIIDNIRRMTPDVKAQYLSEISTEDALQLFHIPSYSFALEWARVIPIEDAIRLGSPMLVRIALASLTNKPGLLFAGFSNQAFTILDERLKQDPRFFIQVLKNNQSAQQFIDPKILVDDLLLRCRNASELEIPDGIVSMLRVEQTMQQALSAFEAGMTNAIKKHYPKQPSPLQQSGLKA
jgi:hypothetical protein